MNGSNIYVGIDLHKRSFTFVMLDADGRRQAQGSCSTEVGAVSDFAARLDRRHQVVLEPLASSFWFIEQVRPYSGSIQLANPYKVRLIAQSRLKNDRIDAWILADLLRVGYLPTVYIPAEEVIEWRRLISHHIRLVHDRTQLRNRILGMIDREGLRTSATDAFGKHGREELDQLPLSALTRRFVEEMLVHHDLLCHQLAGVDAEIKTTVDNDSICQLLQTIDGIGPFTALAVRAAVGEINRFRSPKAFAAYTGLIPSYRQSAETIHNGSITKQGVSTLRWALLQGVNHAMRRSDYLKRLYTRLCFRSSVAKARVAVAHAMARMIYHVWTEARPYYR